MGFLPAHFSRSLSKPVLPSSLLTALCNLVSFTDCLGVPSVPLSGLLMKAVNCMNAASVQPLDTTSYCLLAGLCTTDHSPLSPCIQPTSHPPSHAAIQTRSHQFSDKGTLGYRGKGLAKVRVHPESSQGIREG